MKGGGYYLTGFHPLAGNVGVLRDVPVLAERAVEITAGKTQREYLRPRFKMIERLFFDWVHRQRGDKSVKGNYPFAILVAPDSARAEEAALYMAGIGAKIADNKPVCFGNEQRRAVNAQVAACGPVCRIRSLIACTRPAN